MISILGNVLINPCPVQSENSISEDSLYRCTPSPASLFGGEVENRTPYSKVQTSCFNRILLHPQNCPNCNVVGFPADS